MDEQNKRLSVGIDEETAAMLQAIKDTVKQELGINLSRHGVIKWLANKELASINTSQEV